MNIEMFTLHRRRLEASVLIKVRDDAGLKGTVADRMERSGLAPSIMVHAIGKDARMYEINDSLLWTKSSLDIELEILFPL